MRIHTVTGIIDTGELGETLFHEHIICTSPEIQRVFPDWLPRKKVVDIAVSKIKYAAEKFGIKTIFDATPLSLGRDIVLLKEVSEKSEVQIVAATGFYCYDSFARHKLKVDFLADRLAEDAVNSHASLLKCAVGNDGLTPEAAKTLEVICAAHARTGLPVYIHTAAAAKSGWEAQKFVAGNNVAPEKTVIGHVSDSNDIEYPLELLKGDVMFPLTGYIRTTANLFCSSSKQDLPTGYWSATTTSAVTIRSWKIPMTGRTLRTDSISCTVSSCPNCAEAELMSKP